MRDQNTKKEDYEKLVDQFGFGERHQTGDSLLDSVASQRLYNRGFFKNTHFKKHTRKS